MPLNGLGVLTKSDSHPWERDSHPHPFSQTACPLSATFLAGGKCPFSSVPEKPFLCLPNSWGPASYLPMEGFLWEWSPSGGPLQPVLQVFLSPTLCHFDSIIYF